MCICNLYSPFKMSVYEKKNCTIIFNFFIMNRIRILLTTIVTSVIVLVTISCNRNDADFILHVGETCEIILWQYDYPGFDWIWENQSETNVVSMYKYDYTTQTSASVSDTVLIDGLGGPVAYCFRGEKKGWANICLVRHLGDGEPENRQRIHFSIRVIE